MYVYIVYTVQKREVIFTLAMDGVAAIPPWSRGASSP